ncbi:MAG: DUF4126 domain-containing protein [Cyanobacteria bacterium J06632_19]
MIELLSVLSASAAVGIRIALPVLFFGLMQGQQLWSEVPILSNISSSFLLGLFTSWSIIELTASKKLMGQRILQIVEILFSPIMGAIMGLAVVSATEAPTWLIGITAGLFALVLQLVQLGWFFRLRGLPLWFVLIQDALCIALVLFAFGAPKPGGLIALFLLWFAIYSGKLWYDWYREKKS